MASIGGQLFGAAGVDIQGDARAGATLFYDNNDKKLQQGPKPDDKLNLHVNTEFIPSIQLGGRLVLKLLNQKFNLFQYTFAKWDFGHSAFVFDVLPNDEGKYEIIVDKKNSHINGKSLEEKTLKGLLQKNVEGIDHTAVEDYEVLRDLFDNTEKALKKKDTNLYEHNLAMMKENAVSVGEALIELLANLEIKKEQLQQELLSQKQKEKSGTSLYNLRRAFKDYPSKQLEENLQGINTTIKKLEKEVAKVILINQDAEAAVNALKEKRAKWWNGLDYRRFGIWDELYRKSANDENIGRNNSPEKNATSSHKRINKEIEKLKIQTQEEIKKRTHIIKQKINENQGIRNRQEPDHNNRSR